MPTLTRYLLILAAVAAIGFCVLYALATFVKPSTRPMYEPVPLNRLEQG